MITSSPVRRTAQSTNLLHIQYTYTQTMLGVIHSLKKQGTRSEPVTIARNEGKGKEAFGNLIETSCASEIKKERRPERFSILQWDHLVWIQTASQHFLQGFAICPWNAGFSEKYTHSCHYDSDNVRIQQSRKSEHKGDWKQFPSEEHLPIILNVVYVKSCQYHIVHIYLLVHR